MCNILVIASGGNVESILPFLWVKYILLVGVVFDGLRYTWFNLTQPVSSKPQVLSSTCVKQDEWMKINNVDCDRSGLSMPLAICPHKICVSIESDLSIVFGIWLWVDVRIVCCLVTADEDGQIQLFFCFHFHGSFKSIIGSEKVLGFWGPVFTLIMYFLVLKK
jgi:hypothetical protein